MATFQAWLNDQSNRAGEDPVGWLSRQWAACEGPERPRVSAPNGIRKHLLTLSDDEQWQAAVTRATELASKAYNDARSGGETSAQVSGPAEPQTGRGLTEAELSAFRAQNERPAGDQPAEPELSGQAASQMLFPDMAGAGAIPGTEPNEVELLGAATGMLLQSVAALAERQEHLIRLAQLSLHRLDVVSRHLNIEPEPLDQAMAAAVAADGPEQPWNHGRDGLWGTQPDSQPAGELDGFAAWMGIADPDADA